MITNPSPRELADEMRRVLKETRMTPHEHFEFLVKHGIIDRDGNVLVCRYFRTDLPPDRPDTPIQNGSQNENGTP